MNATETANELMNSMRSYIESVKALFKDYEHFSNTDVLIPVVYRIKSNNNNRIVVKKSIHPELVLEYNKCRSIVKSNLKLRKIHTFDNISEVITLFSRDIDKATYTLCKKNLRLFNKELFNRNTCNLRKCDVLSLDNGADLYKLYRESKVKSRVYLKNLRETLNEIKSTYIVVSKPAIVETKPDIDSIQGGAVEDKPEIKSVINAPAIVDSIIVDTEVYDPDNDLGDFNPELIFDYLNSRIDLILNGVEFNKREEEYFKELRSEINDVLDNLKLKDKQLVYRITYTNGETVYRTISSNTLTNIARSIVTSSNVGGPDSGMYELTGSDAQILQNYAYEDDILDFGFEVTDAPSAADEGNYLGFLIDIESLIELNPDLKDLTEKSLSDAQISDVSVKEKDHFKLNSTHCFIQAVKMAFKYNEVEFEDGLLQSILMKIALKINVTKGVYIKDVNEILRSLDYRCIINKYDNTCSNIVQTVDGGSKIGQSITITLFRGHYFYNYKVVKDNYVTTILGKVFTDPNLYRICKFNITRFNIESEEINEVIQTDWYKPLDECSKYDGKKINYARVMNSTNYSFYNRFKESTSIIYMADFESIVSPEGRDSNVHLPLSLGIMKVITDDELVDFNDSSKPLNDRIDNLKSRISTYTASSIDELEKCSIFTNMLDELNQEIRVDELNRLDKVGDKYKYIVKKKVVYLKECEVPKITKPVIYFHNLKYDSTLIKKNSKIVVVKETVRGSSIYSMDVKYNGRTYILKDSYKMLATKLDSFKRDFDLNLGKMNEFKEYELYTVENFNKTELQCKNLDHIHEKYKNGNILYHMKYLDDYLRLDVLTLMLGLKTFDHIVRTNITYADDTYDDVLFDYIEEINDCGTGSYEYFVTSNTPAMDEYRKNRLNLTGCRIIEESPFCCVFKHGQDSYSISITKNNEEFEYYKGTDLINTVKHASGVSHSKIIKTGNFDDRIPLQPNPKYNTICSYLYKRGFNDNLEAILSDKNYGLRTNEIKLDALCKVDKDFCCFMFYAFKRLTTPELDLENDHINLNRIMYLSPFSCLTVNSLSKKYAEGAGCFDDIAYLSGYTEAYIQQFVVGGHTAPTNAVDTLDDDKLLIYNEEKLPAELLSIVNEELNKEPESYKKEVRNVFNYKNARKFYHNIEPKRTYKHIQNIDSTIEYYDVVSSYPSSMVRLGGLPCGLPCKIKKNTPYEKLVKNCTAFFVYCEFKINKNQQIPMLSTKVDICKETGERIVSSKGGRRAWTNNVNSGYLSNIDLEDIIKFHKATDIVIHHGLGWLKSNGTNDFLTHFVNRIFNLRLKAKKEKKTGLSNTYKLFLNGLYGGMLLRDTQESVEWKYFDKTELNEYISTNAGRVGNITELGKRAGKNIYRIDVESNSIKSKNRAHIGALVLSMSKRILNEVFDIANDYREMTNKGMNIFYCDTDSMKITRDCLEYVKQEYITRYGKELDGTQLNQFHVDYEKPAHFKCDKPSSVLTITLGRKCYLDVLSGYDGEIGYQFRFKGCSKSNIIYRAGSDKLEDILRLYLKGYRGEVIDIDITKDYLRLEIDTKRCRIRQKNSGDTGYIKTFQF